MDGTTDWNPDDRTEQVQPTDSNPVSWTGTEELDALLWNAVTEDSSWTGDEDSGDFDEIDEFLTDDDDEGDEDEGEQRRATLRLLATLRPQLAELLGGPTAE